MQHAKMFKLFFVGRINAHLLYWSAIYVTNYYRHPQNFKKIQINI